MNEVYALPTEEFPPNHNEAYGQQPWSHGLNSMMTENDLQSWVFAIKPRFQLCFYEFARFVGKAYCGNGSPVLGVPISWKIVVHKHLLGHK
jgi:hypothetical protein